MSTFKLAHLSDVHLSPLPPARPGQLLNKRFIGYLSWTRRRRMIHDNRIASALVRDITRHKPAHVALTGDLVNISLPAEFIQAAGWLQDFGASNWITIVPGNHDTYIKVPWDRGLSHWADYMTGDLTTPGHRLAGGHAGLFPFVRQRRNIAIIGVSSAVPAPLHKASGTVGTRQIASLEGILDNLHAKGFYRVIMIHHPPLPGQAKPRKALTDAPAFAGLLQTHGAELVLHGHNHSHMLTRLDTRTGPCHIVGVPSASAKKTAKKPAAAWYEYEISRTGGSWTTAMTIHDYDPDSGQLVARPQFYLD